MKLNKEDFEWCKNVAEHDLSTTQFLQYKSATPTAWNNIVADILDRTLNTQVKRNYTCGSCIYNLWKRLAEIYFKDKEELEKKEEELKKKRQENMEKARQSKNNKLINE